MLEEYILSKSVYFSIFFTLILDSYFILIIKIHFPVSLDTYYYTKSLRNINISINISKKLWKNRCSLSYYT